MPSVKSAPSYLSRDEILRLENVIDDPITKCVVEIALYAGFRISEILNLRYCDIDFERDTVSVTPRQKEYTPKDREFRTVPLHPALKSYLVQSPLFLKRHSHIDFIFQSLTYLFIRKKAKKYFRKASIKNGSLHLLKHTFASRLVQNGASIYAVSKLLGHTNIKTTMNYAHLSPEHLNAAVMDKLYY